MKSIHKSRNKEKGIALLIAIFVLLLISVVAIALLVSSGTETALGANYRSSSIVYYAALAGLEEARGRLLPKNPNYFTASYIPPGTSLATMYPLGKTFYVTNSIPGETVAPWDSSNQYYDKEYKSEFGVEASSASWGSRPSVWDNNAQGIPGPAYKWVRINAVTETSIHTDVNYDSSWDSTTPLFYDPANVDSSGNLRPGLIVTTTPPATAAQAFEITSLAELPNGSQKYLQYLVAASTVNLTFPSALTLAGSNVGNNATYPMSFPNSALFLVNGTDQFVPSGSSCVPSSSPAAAIGYTNNSDASRSNINAAVLSGGYPGNYSGAGYAAGPPPTASVQPVGTLLAPNLQTVSGLNALVQTITQNADVVLPGGLTQSDLSNHMPSWMSGTNPATVVVNGDITFNAWHSTGTGILLVTGQLKFDPDASWDGIVLVIGKGILYGAHQSGSGRFHGAVFLARTVDSSNNPLPPTSPLGSPSFSFTSDEGSDGIFYSGCYVKYVQTPFRYQVLSFHEIPQ